MVEPELGKNVWRKHLFCMWNCPLYVYFLLEKIIKKENQRVLQRQINVRIRYPQLRSPKVCSQIRPVNVESNLTFVDLGRVLSIFFLRKYPPTFRTGR